MRIGFFDYTDWDYKVDNAQQMPSRESHAPLCHLAKALVCQGHEIFLFNHTSLPGIAGEVSCIPIESASETFIQSLDVLIVFNDSGHSKSFRHKLNPQALLILWTQHAADRAEVESLGDRTEQECYDAIVFASNWQQEEFCQRFDIDPTKTFVLRNAIAPAFQDLFSPDEAICAHKEQPPVLAYISNSCRGLEVLLNLFPEIRDRVPGVRLKVFSSVQEDQVSSDPDRQDYERLYQRCMDTEDVEYVGSIPQPQLAEELRRVTALTYPNTFPETSCIEVMEALASGCWVVASALGGLPETTAGFGRLIPVTEDDDAYTAQFIAEMVDVLTRDRAEAEAHLRSQVSYANQVYTWEVRAKQWSDWLSARIERKGGVAFAPYSPAYRGYHMMIRKRFEEAVRLFEKAMATEPEVLRYYWYLGLALLLSDREEEAQATWLSVMVEADPEQAETWSADLVRVLMHEAERQQQLQDNRLAWVLRRYIREVSPGSMANSLKIIDLSVSLELLDDLDELQIEVAERLKSQELTETERSLLLTAFEKLVAFDLLSEGLEDVLVKQVSQSPDLARVAIQHIEAILEKGKYPSSVLVRFAEFELRLRPRYLPLLATAIGLYQNMWDYDTSIQLADRFISHTTHRLDRIAGFYLSIKALLSSGENFYRAKQYHDELIGLQEELMASEEPIQGSHLQSVIATTSFFPYLADEPDRMHRFRRRFASFWQTQIQARAQSNRYRVVTSLSPSQADREKPLNIGYLSACFSNHSVGFLSRWLFKYANRDRYHLHAYSLTEKVDELQQFFAENATFRDISKLESIEAAAAAIAKDKIDILVDLDSLTSVIACAIVALKPAPIQVTWLGFDSSGLPAIDYFIADPYVLPESAQAYYGETIWRLPDAYVAVDGFEVDIPNLRKSDLDIPDDAVVYFSSQTGQKRHPENVKLQLEILKKVPNSYFLVKGHNVNRKDMQSFFDTVADVVGVDKSRIKYLPLVASEKVHRANIAIADVVLDTYPYNGATTTLETLWMGIPIVTQVGEQFAARNSYTMLRNAGVTEGIAWTEAEYVEWGIRMGQDLDLRRRVANTLRSSRQTSPLWDGKRFTRIMENALRSMWHDFLISKSRT